MNCFLFFSSFFFSYSATLKPNCGCLTICLCFCFAFYVLSMIKASELSLDNKNIYSKWSNWIVTLHDCLYITRVCGSFPPHHIHTVARCRTLNVTSSNSHEQWALWAYSESKEAIIQLDDSHILMKHCQRCYRFRYSCTRCVLCTVCVLCVWHTRHRHFGLWVMDSSDFGIVCTPRICGILNWF